VNSKNTYIGLGILILASVTAAYLFRFSVIIQDIAAVPAIVALFAALFQIGRDRIAHERSLFMLESQNSFSIGATSHMAGVAFDRYSAFCEEYVQEMYEALMTLTREGPRKSALTHSDNLIKIEENGLCG
jgi:hypothetical protein